MHKPAGIMKQAAIFPMAIARAGFRLMKFVANPRRLLFLALMGAALLSATCTEYSGPGPGRQYERHYKEKPEGGGTLTPGKTLYIGKWVSVKCIRVWKSRGKTCGEVLVKYTKFDSEGGPRGRNRWNLTLCDGQEKEITTTDGQTYIIRVWFGGKATYGN